MKCVSKSGAGCENGKSGKALEKSGSFLIV